MPPLKKQKGIDTMIKTTYVNAIDIALSLIDVEDTAIVFHDDSLGTSHDVTMGDVRTKLEALKTSLEKRNSSKSGKPTKVQIANAEIGASVVSAMESGVDYTIADIKGLVPALADANPQKVSPIMRKLTEGGKVEAVKVKGKVAYHLA